MHNWNHALNGMTWERERKRESEGGEKKSMWLRLGTSFYCLKNKQENEQNGTPEKPYENLIDGYYLAAPGWMAVVRFKRLFIYLFSCRFRSTSRHVRRMRPNRSHCRDLSGWRPARGCEAKKSKLSAEIQILKGNLDGSAWYESWRWGWVGSVCVWGVKSSCAPMWLPSPESVRRASMPPTEPNLQLSANYRDWDVDAIRGAVAHRHR